MADLYFIFYFVKPRQTIEVGDSRASSRAVDEQVFGCSACRVSSTEIIYLCLCGQNNSIDSTGCGTIGIG